MKFRIKKLYSSIIRLTLVPKRSLYLGRDVEFRGRPLIEIENGGSVHVGSRVRLNSRNRGYHVNMFGPVKLFADMPGATIRIGEDTRIHGACIHAYSSIVIGKRCLIAANTQIVDGSGHDLCLDTPEHRILTIGTALPIVIEDDVWVGMNCIVLPGVTIGRGSVIGAGSVVTKDIPPGTVAAGNPARVIRGADANATAVNQ